MKGYHQPGLKYIALRGRENADVAVVGGGVSGVSIALWLSRTGLKVTLVEAERIGWGATGKNAGILAASQKAIVAELNQQKGKRAAEAYMHTYAQAVRSIVDICRTADADARLRKYGGGLIAASDQGKELLHFEAEVMRQIGIKADINRNSALPEPFSYILALPELYVLEPAGYMEALTRSAVRNGVRIHEHSRVIAVETDEVHTREGSVRAQYIVIATGYPVVDLPGWYFLRLDQQKLVLSQCGMRCTGLYFAAKERCSFRPHRGGMLMCADHRGEETFFPKGRIEGSCERAALGMECFTPDGLPYIGRYSSKTPKMYVACGYGGNGIASSMVAAQALCAYIMGLSTDRYELFSPERKLQDISMPVSLSCRYLKGIWGGAEVPRCSHMGCRLNFNPVTRLWECPCHGSVFDDIGRVVNAPAVKPANLRGRK